MQGSSEDVYVVRKARTLSQRGRICFLLAATLFSLTLTAWAQNATIMGTVTDPTGAVIPGARVTVINHAVGFTRTSMTNSVGAYIAAEIPIGAYVVTAEASGFRSLVRTGVVLQVGETLRLNLTMTLGQTSQRVTVSGSAAKVNTVNGTISDVVTGHQIENLSLVGRNYQMLTMLTPGAAPENGFAQSVEQLGHNASANINFNGIRDYSNNFEVDGAQNNDTSSGGPSPDTFPALDSIAEFRIQTSNYSADTGMRPGASIDVLTKSGTSEFHGDAYEFVRNDAFDANDWFANRVIAPPGGNAPKTPLKWNLYGYTLGGPFYIPGVYNIHKSKTFFFWSESWARYRQGTVISGNVPSMRMRMGDFTECDPTSGDYSAVFGGACRVPINPATGVKFPGDMVPITPTAETLMNDLVPLPNNGPIGYLSNASQPTNWRQEQIRVDQNVSDKVRAFVRYTQDSWNQTLAPALWSNSTFDSITSPWEVPAKNAVLNITDTIHPNLLNEFMLAYGNDAHVIRTAPGPGSPAHSILKPANWSMGSIFPGNRSDTNLPEISVCGGDPFCFSEDASYDSNYNSTLPTITLKDNVVYAMGHHTLKTGVFYMYYRDASIVPQAEPQGQLSFTGGGPITTGNALADMYLGRIQSYTEGTAYNYNNGTTPGGWLIEHGEWRDFEPYFEDDWNINRKLILNLGLRYEYNWPTFFRNTNPNINVDFLPSQFNINDAPQIDINGNLIPGSGHFYTSPGNGQVVCGPASAGGTAGLPKSCIHPPHDLLAPRFGFAFDPTGSGKTSIRGGFGVFYGIEDGLLVGGEETAGTPPTVLGPVGSNIVGYQSIVSGPLGVTSLGGFPTNFSWPWIAQYNMTIEHQFPGNNFLSVGWVGTLGRHLDDSINLNQVPDGIGTKSVPALAGTPGCDAQGNCDVQDILIQQYEPSYYFVPYRGFSRITWLQTAATSNYNSLQVNFRHTVGHGLTFQTSYTWSHSLDNESGAIGDYGVDDTNLARWYGSSDFNRSQVLTMNYTYNLPFFHNSSNSFLRNGLGGWMLSGITSFFSGTPISFNCGVSGYSSGIGGAIQCNTVGPLKPQKGTFDDPIFGPTPTWYNSAVVQQPYESQLFANGQSGMFGYMGRNVLTGPGLNNWDIALFKNFKAPWFSGEHSTIQFRLETFNTFNHPQWLSVNAGCGTLTPFGSSCTDTGVSSSNYQIGEVTSAEQPRIMQLGLKFIF